MDVAAKFGYRLIVDHREMNIIGLALGGLLKPDQESEARELNRKLLEHKRASLTQHLVMAEKALQDIKGDPNE